MRTNRIIPVFALGLVLAPVGTACAAEFFRITPPPASAASSTAPSATTNSDPSTGLTVSIPCAACQGRVTKPFSFQPSANMPVAGWSILSGTLPPGLGIDGATGLISGAPTAVGSFSFIMQLAQTTGSPLRSPTVAVSINPLPSVSYLSSGGAYGRTINLTPATSYTTGPGKYALTAGSLPSGVILNPDTGAFTGTVLSSSPGLKVTYTDADGTSGTSNAFDILSNISPALNYATSSYSGRVGATLTSATPTRSALAASPNIRLGTGILPPGLGVDPNSGVISGTPAVSGSFPGVSFTANTSNGSTVNSNTLSFSVGQPSVKYTDASGQVGMPLSQSPVVAFFNTPQFYVNSGALPAGVALSQASGTVSGTPTAAGTFPLTVLALDPGPVQAVSPTFTLSITPALATASTSSVSVVEGSPVTFSATSSFTNPTWSASGNPAWMTFALSGGAYGTTSASADVSSTQSYPVVLTARDTSGATISTNVAVQVSPATATVADVSARAGAAFSTPVSQTMVATGAWTATASPADVVGLAVSGGNLTGTAPANTGTAAITRTLTANYTSAAAPSSGASAVATGTGTLTVQPGLTIASLADQTIPTTTAASIAAPAVTGKIGALTYTLLQGTTDVSSTLSSTCAGLSFSKATGAIAGTPTAACTVSLTHRVSDDGGGTASFAATATSAAPFTLKVVSATVTASTTALTVTEGDAVAFSATTGLPNPTWSVSGNPAWMTFTTSNGTYATSSVSADVTAVETYTVTLTATGGGSSAQQAVTVTVNPSTVTLATSAPVRSGGAFTAVVAKSMVAAGAWATSANPADVANLTLSGSNLTGTAPANPGPGTLSRTLTAAYTATTAPSAGARATASASSTLSVYPGLLIAAPANQGGTAGNTVAFSAPSVTGQVGALTWTLLQGASDVSTSLGTTCPGLSFSKTTGAVSGTATSSCSMTLAYRVADDGGSNASLAATATSSTFSLSVAPAAATASTSSVSVTEGDTVTYSATTGLSNPTWSASGNPAWMTFTQTGGSYATSSVSADVASSTTYTVTLTATNASGVTSPTTVTVTVAPAGATVANAAVRSGASFSSAVTQTMTAAGTWSASANPADVAGLTVTGSTLTGTAPANSTTAAVTRALTVTYTASAAPSSGARALASSGGTLTVHPLFTVGNQAAQTLYTGTGASIAAPAVSGRVGGLTWALLSGSTDVSSSLSSTCAGLTFNSGTGVISGTPTAPCSPNLTYRASDDGGGVSTLVASATSQPFALTVNASNVTTSDSSLSVQEGETVRFSATTNLPNPTWSMTGVFPAWMTFTASGNTATVNSVSGDVTANSTYTPILKAVSTAGTAQAQVSVNVNMATATVATPALVHGGKPFSATVAETMTTAGTWSASAGNADVTGLGISGTTLSGTAPANAGTSAITRTLTANYVSGTAPSSGTAATATGTATLTVSPPVGATVDKTISATTRANITMVGPNATNLIGTASWSTTSTLPTGVTVDSATGKLTGQATQAGTFPISFQVTDSDGSSASATGTLTVTSNDPVLSLADTPSGTQINGVAYSNGMTTTMPGPVTTALNQNYGFWMKNNGPTDVTGLHFSINGDSADPDAFNYGDWGRYAAPRHELSPTVSSAGGGGNTCYSTLAVGKTCYMIIAFRPANNGQKVGTLTVTAQNMGQPVTLKMNVTADKILPAGRMFVNAAAGWQSVQLPVQKNILARYMLLSGGVAGIQGNPPGGGPGPVVVVGNVYTTTTGTVLAVVSKGGAPGGDATTVASNLRTDYDASNANTAYAAFTGPYAKYGVSGGGGRSDSTPAGMSTGLDGGSGTLGGGNYLRGYVSGGPYTQDLTGNSYPTPTFKLMTWAYGAGGKGGGPGIKCSGQDNYVLTGSGGGGGLVFDGNVVAAGAANGTGSYPGTAGTGYGAGGGGGVLAAQSCGVANAPGGAGGDAILYLEWDLQ